MILVNVVAFDESKGETVCFNSNLYSNDLGKAKVFARNLKKNCSSYFSNVRIEVRSYKLLNTEILEDF